MIRVLFITIIMTSIWGSILGQDSLKIQKKGLYTGLNFGTWFPDNKNKVLGNPSIIGFTIDFKGVKNSLGLNFDLIGGPIGKTKEPITIKFGDSLLIRNEYSGSQLTIDYCRQFLETNRFVFEGLCGIGHGQLTYFNSNKDTDVDKSTIIFSPGINIRLALSKKLFLQMKTQYYIANYKLKDNVSTSFKGNYLMTKLIISGLSNNM